MILHIPEFFPPVEPAVDDVAFLAQSWEDRETGRGKMFMMEGNKTLLVVKQEMND